MVLRETWSREIMDMSGRERALTTKSTAIIISIADTAVHFVIWQLCAHTHTDLGHGGGDNAGLGIQPPHSPPPGSGSWW